MKKLGILLLIVAMSLVFVSCNDHVHSFKTLKAATCIEDGAQECEECGEQVTLTHDVKYHVDTDSDGLCDVCNYSSADRAIAASTFEEFVSAIGYAQATGCNAVIVKADLAWDASVLDSGKFEPVVTGLTIDFGAKTLSEIPANSLNFKGDNFTLKNGTIKAKAGYSGYSYSLTVNYNTTSGDKDSAEAKIPTAYSDSDAIWAKRVIIDGITTDSCLIGYSTVEVKNSSFIGGVKRGLVMQGSSGVIQDTMIETAAEADSAGVVAHSYGVVTFKGTVSAKGKFGLYAAGSGKAVVAEGATLTLDAYQTYGAYVETLGEATFGAGVTLKTANGSHVYMNGGTLTLNNGVALKDKDGNSTEKLVVSEKKDSENTINDNRVCSHASKVHNAEKAADCGNDGNVEYWYCNGCEKFFSDEACTTEIPAANVTIAASGSHTPVHHDRVEPVGSTDGSEEHWTCSVCEKYFSDAACTTETTADDVVITAHTATNHKNDVNGVCTVCGFKSADSKFHVSTFAQFEEALAIAGNATSKYVVVDADLVFDAETYPGLKGSNYSEANAYHPNVTGLEIDFAGHSMTGIPRSNALNFTGNNFTIKNATFTLGSTAVNSSIYALCINYSGATTKADGLAHRVTESTWANRIILDNVTSNGIFIGFSTAEIKNVTAANFPYRGLVMWGTSGTIDNFTASDPGAKSSNAGLNVQVYAQVTLTGNINVTGKQGLQCDKAATVTAGAGTMSFTANGASYPIYAISQSVINLNDTTTITAYSGYEPFCVTKNSKVVVPAGATIIDMTGATVEHDGTVTATAAITNVLKVSDGTFDANYTENGVSAPTLIY